MLAESPVKHNYTRGRATRRRMLSTSEDASRGEVPAPYGNAHTFVLFLCPVAKSRVLEQ